MHSTIMALCLVWGVDEALLADLNRFPSREYADFRMKSAQDRVKKVREDLHITRSYGVEYCYHYSNRRKCDLISKMVESLDREGAAFYHLRDAKSTQYNLQTRLNDLRELKRLLTEEEWASGQMPFTGGYYED